MLIIPLKTRVFIEKESLIDFVEAYIPRIKDGSVIVITSKIVALSEGRTAVVRNEKEKDALIKSESDFALKTKWVWLTIRDNMIMASAGVDESNGNGKIILLPKDSFAVASRIRRHFMKKHGLKRLGVVITDSRLFPLRGGTVGVALGYAGFRGINSYKKKRDIFGRPFKFQCVDVADSVATAAVLTMGEGDEQIPLALIENAPVEFIDRVDRRELEIDIKDDIYGPLYARARKIVSK